MTAKEIYYAISILKNKTFMNAHLIKNKLADVDSSITFKYKDKFLQMEKEGNRYPK